MQRQVHANQDTLAAPGRPAQAGTGPGVWAGRPPGVPGSVPPPPVPLAFFAAAAAGLAACGAAFVAVRSSAALDPTADPVVTAAHLGLLATLSMGVLGALHQFVPVVTGRPLRSLRLAWATFATWLGAAWLLPLGIGVGQVGVVEAGGTLGAAAFVLLLANLSPPLAVQGKGATVTGLRSALAGFALTGAFGVVYLADRQGNWFDLAGHVVLAHAVVGVFAWLGLAYVAVAEKLWPMFFLAHVPGRRLAGALAVRAVPAGVVLLSPGLLLGVVPLAVAGAALLGVGLGAHLVSLAAHVRHRRRRADLHLLFVLTAAALCCAGAGLALAGVLVLPGHHRAGTALAAGAVAAFACWLLEALVGHVHKVVPFILWSALRARGVNTGPSGAPLLFADLYDHRLAAASYATVTAGTAALCVGLAASAPVATAVGGVLLVLTAVGVAANLTLTPLRLLARSARRAAPTPS